ncbi:hypothetical protein GHT09_000479 [Marmota monax]|uniref:Uncharacterized protein n=1 Tax=Marmota monax TaxID=9995 RepID=A0A834Q2Q4_MARMO|nr:hypothetical protein GHT09_000479 [Marmota monax]
MRSRTPALRTGRPDRKQMDECKTVTLRKQHWAMRADGAGRSRKTRESMSGARGKEQENKENPQREILANVIIFICGNLAGAYHKHLMELALQQTYQDTCNCIKSRIKLEFEKRQQQVSGTCCSHWMVDILREETAIGRRPW